MNLCGNLFGCSSGIWLTVFILLVFLRTQSSSFFLGWTIYITVQYYTHGWVHLAFLRHSHCNIARFEAKECAAGWDLRERCGWRNKFAITAQNSFLSVSSTYLKTILAIQSQPKITDFATAVQVTGPQKTFTVPFHSNRQGPWRVTALPKFWFRQPPKIAVTSPNFGKFSAV